MSTYRAGCRRLKASTLLLVLVIFVILGGGGGHRDSAGRGDSGRGHGRGGSGGGRGHGGGRGGHGGNGRGLLKISDFAPTGLVNPKFQVDVVARPRLHSMQHGKNEIEISSVQ